MIPRLVPEISPCDAFCDEQEEQELGILGVRYLLGILDQAVKICGNAIVRLKVAKSF